APISTRVPSIPTVSASVSMTGITPGAVEGEVDGRTGDVPDAVDEVSCTRVDRVGRPEFPSELEAIVAEGSVMPGSFVGVIRRWSLACDAPLRQLDEVERKRRQESCLPCLAQAQRRHEMPDSPLKNGPSNP